MSLNDKVSGGIGSPFVFDFQRHRQSVGKWESCFWISTFPRGSWSGRRECGNRGSDFQGLVDNVLFLVAGPRHIFFIVPQWAPTECMQGTSRLKSLSIS